MKNKKILSVILLSVFILLLGGCTSSPIEDTEEDDILIGISMPSKALERWEKDGNFMVQKFEELGYETNIQYAQDGVETQVDQIENLITRGVDALVIAPIDGEALSPVIDRAKKEGIPVIAYDRLIMHSDGIDYYVTFDLINVGRLQGQYIADALELESGKGPFNIELFGGSPDDNNARYFYEGAMEVLNPYIENGQLVVQSGQTNFNQIATKDWNGAEAQRRMDDILSSSYGDNNLDAVLGPNDAVGLGIVSSVKAFGYGKEGRPLPIITGQDAEAASIKSIIRGEQTMTVFKDTQALATVTVEMIDNIMNGKEVTVNDTETYDNGEKVVPANLLDPIAVDQSNYNEILIESGYLNESDIN